MNEYLAFVKEEKHSTPVKLVMQCREDAAALSEMCALMRVESTVELYEYQILQVLKGGLSLRPVMDKVAGLPALPPPAKTETFNVKAELVEATYKPYTKKEAA